MALCWGDLAISVWSCEHFFHRTHAFSWNKEDYQSQVLRTKMRVRGSLKKIKNNLEFTKLAITSNGIGSLNWASSSWFPWSIEWKSGGTGIFLGPECFFFHSLHDNWLLHAGSALAGAGKKVAAEPFAVKRYFHFVGGGSPSLRSTVRLKAKS